MDHQHVPPRHDWPTAGHRVGSSTLWTGSRKETGMATSPTPTPRPEQAWTGSPNSSTTSTTSATQPNDASSTAPCSPASPSTTKKTPPTHPSRPPHRPCPHQHRRPGARHRRNKTAPPSGGASYDFLILRGANGIRTRDLLHAMQTRYQLRHSPKSLGVAVATPAILHAHWAAAKSGGRFSDVSLTHPAPSRARLTSTTAR